MSPLSSVAVAHPLGSGVAEREAAAKELATAPTCAAFGFGRGGSAGASGSTNEFLSKAGGVAAA